jgi:hypothetical protein
VKIVCGVRDSQIPASYRSVPDPYGSGEQPGESRHFAVSALSGTERYHRRVRELVPGRLVRESHERAIASISEHPDSVWVDPEGNDRESALFGSCCVRSVSRLSFGELLPRCLSYHDCLSSPGCDCLDPEDLGDLRSGRTRTLWVLLSAWGGVAG